MILVEQATNFFNLSVNVRPGSDCLASLSLYYDGTYQLIQEEYELLDFFRIPYGRYKLVLRKERFRTCTVFFTVTENYILYDNSPETIHFKRYGDTFINLNVVLVRR